MSKKSSADRIHEKQVKISKKVSNLQKYTRRMNHLYAKYWTLEDRRQKQELQETNPELAFARNIQRSQWLQKLSVIDVFVDCFESLDAVGASEAHDSIQENCSDPDHLTLNEPPIKKQGASDCSVLACHDNVDQSAILFLRYLSQRIVPAMKNKRKHILKKLHRSLLDTPSRPEMRRADPTDNESDSFRRFVEEFQ
jgi:hypothetical protein